MMTRFLIGCAVAMAVSAPSFAVDCEKMIKIHSFLSRAQFQCGFSKYADSLMKQARECGQHLGEARIDEHLKAGIELFDQRETERGHKQMCADVLKTFPGFIGR